MTTRLGLVTLATNSPMGQQVYEREVAARARAELGEGWEVDDLGIRSLRSRLPGAIRVPAGLLVGTSPGLRRVVGRLAYRGYDIVHRFDLRLPPAGCPEVLTVHDVVPWRFPDEGAPPADAASTARRAAVVICPSQFSADEVAAELGVAAPVAIHNGVDARFASATPLPEHQLAEWGIRAPFVLHAGGCTQRKNLGGLAAAWPRVRSARPDASLVLVGPPDERRTRLFAPLEGTVLSGRLADEDVGRLMAAAACVVVPSLYEGFGLPALEGMAVGVPVVAADRASLPEVCGDAALLVEPDGNGLAEGIVSVLAGGAEVSTRIERGRTRAATFTWESSAAAHARLWRAVLG